MINELKYSTSDEDVESFVQWKNHDVGYLFCILTNDIVFFFLLKPYPNRGRNFRIILFVVIYQWGKIHGCRMNVSQRSFARVNKGMVVV